MNLYKMKLKKYVEFNLELSINFRIFAKNYKIWHV